MKRALASLALASVLWAQLPVFGQAQAVLIPTDAAAQGFNPNAILSDEDMFELGDWNADSIQRFFASKGSALAVLKLKDIDGVEKRPADILWRVAGSYKINPKYLLALIQKEQSLVEGRAPSQKQLDWAAGYAVCDSCSMDDPDIQAFKGFANQIEYAAKQHRERYLFQMLTSGTTIGGYAPGKLSYVDAYPIIPENQATAMLYSYTPHLHGNQNLWRIWKRWFALALPDGTVVRDKDTGAYYVIRSKERRPVSKSVLMSFTSDLTKAVSLSAADIEAYPLGASVKFPNFSLVELPDGTRYLLNGQQKRLIVSKSVFSSLGFQEDEVVSAVAEDLAAYTDGADVTEASRYPTGLLAKDAAGDHWYVEDGVRHKIPNKAFLSLYFKGRPARTLKTNEWKAYAIGDPYRLKDGELVRSVTNSAVYVIDQGKRRPFLNGDDFLAFGYEWKNVLTLPDSLLNDYAIGDAMEPAWQPPAAPADPLELSTDVPPSTVSTTLSSLSL